MANLFILNHNLSLVGLKMFSLCKQISFLFEKGYRGTLNPKHCISLHGIKNSRKMSPITTYCVL